MNGTDLITFLMNNFPTVMTTVSAITGSLFTAIFLRYNTSANEFEKIKAGHLKEAANELLKSGKMTYTEYYKAKNFLNIAEKADECFSQNQTASNVEYYDFDWFVRFYEAVGNISNEQMQLIWARILSGEINHPGSFSLRTIEVLKNLSQNDAELFGKICSFTVSKDEHIFIPYYNSYLSACGITYGEIMRLDELGLINSNGMLVLEITVPQSQTILFYNNKLTITAKAAKKDSVVTKVKQFPLTKIGRELSRIQTIANPDDCFVILARELSKNQEINIGLHVVLDISDYFIHYETKNLLEELEIE